MRRSRFFFGLLVACCAGTAAAQMPTCEQIREQIQAQTGVLSSVDTELLKKLSARQECRFSAAEVYRAAYGDKPLPKQESHHHKGARHHEDDD